jgi:hypothetical protein
MIHNADEEKKTTEKSFIPQTSIEKDTLYNLFLNHLLRPREWTA